MNILSGTLSTTSHDRDTAGMAYVYPVVSRRAGGVSVGVNLNPNNACNWRCLYCQVPNLRRGGPAPIDLVRLDSELRHMLAHIVRGDFMSRHVPRDAQRFSDVALSGNGEPTSAPEFPMVVELIGQAMADFGLLAQGVKLLLISNGSLAHRATVLQGIRRMATLNGEVWFKFDRATPSGMHLVNDTETDPERHFQRLKAVAGLCPTWIQTCMFTLDGAPPSDQETQAYLDMLARCRRERIGLAGVLLYGLARASMQPEASRIGTLDPDWLKMLAERIEALGLPLRLTP
ncbi:MAG TPA: radical SAM protein [Thiobacillaceae bacterium]|nr:radical SAM protein [Thiobacillaceae bacterium]HNU64700.1 radical SAM protein [Thiobacillaceae bacterium]